MVRMVSGILQQYGTAMTLQHVGQAEEISLRGFFQPVRSKSWQNATYLATPLGEITRGQYVYIGPVDVEVREGDSLHLGGRTYYFRRVEPYYYGDEQVYLWGLCVEKGVNDTWESQS